MAIVWPLTLPQRPLYDGYSRKGPNMLLRTSMDSGPDKVRYRGGHKPHVADVVYVMDARQVDIFETFVNGTLKGGAVCFDWPHPETGVAVRARLVGSSDAVYTVQPYQKTLHYQVSLKVEFWPDITGV